MAKVVLDEKVSSISELARFAGVGSEVVSREVTRLEHLGYVSTSTQAGNTLVTNQLRGQMLGAITTRLMSAVGPVILAPQIFAKLEGLDRLFIIGSWAARYLGWSGPPPGDIDIVLLGDVKEEQANRAANALESALGIILEVQIFLIEAENWDDPNDSFWIGVKTRPFINLSPALRAAQISNLASTLNVAQAWPPYSD